MTKYIKNGLSVALTAVMITSLCTACTKDNSSTSSSASSGSAVTETEVSTAEIDFSYSDRDKDASYDETTATKITLGDTVSIDGDGATADDKIITITDEGTYIVTGTLSDGQLIVKTADDAKVQLVLKGAEISCSNNAPIYIEEADKVFITLADGTDNKISDGSSFDGADSSLGIDGTVYSKADLTFNGTGNLSITGNCEHGIVSKDDLVFCSGNYTIKSTGDAIQGKDSIKIADGTYTIEAGSDGIQSDNEEDTTKGFISIDGGSLDITAGCDGIQAQTVLRIEDGTVNITSGTGSGYSETDSTSTQSNVNNEPPMDGGNRGDWSVQEETDTESAKGLKAGSLILVEGGECNIDSSDDTVHSNADFQINGGKLVLKSGDDGIHADANIIINDGEIKIKKSYEGIEAANISVAGGNVSLVASDDGFNASDGSSSGEQMGGGGFGGPQSSGGSAIINITGGYILVDASGDGMDSNGSFTMSGGTLLVSGPINDGNGAFDYDSTASITGGTAIIAGSSGMAQNFSSSSNQSAFIYGYSSTQSGGTNITLTDSDGNVIASFTPSKDYQTVVISSPDVKTGEDYTLYAGATVDCADDNSYANSGSISGGTSVETFSLSSEVSNVGNSVGGMGGGPGGNPSMGGGHGGFRR